MCSFTPIGLWQPKILFAISLMNLNMLSISESRMLEPNLFHSIMVKKYEFLKNLCFTLTWGILCAFLVLYWQFDCRIISKSCFGDWFLYIFKKRHSFIYQRLCWRDSKPSPWKFFSSTFFFCLDVLSQTFTFSLGFLSQAFTVHRAVGEGGGFLFDSVLSLPSLSKRLLQGAQLCA